MRAQSVVHPLLPGEVPQPVASSQMPNPEMLSLGMSLSTQFDDNALNSQNKQVNLLTLVEPNVGWSLSIPSARWDLDYRPGFSVGYPVSAYDYRSQLLDTNLQLMMTNRLQFRVREGLLRSKNIFDRLQQSQLAPGSSVLDRPNESVFATTQENSEQAGGDLSYALSPRTVVGTSGALYRVNYRSALNVQALGSAKALGAHAFASYQLRRHHWFGFDYNIQNLISGRPQARSLVQSVLYTDTRRLRPTMEFSFFIGPQHLLTHNEPDSSFAQATGMQSAPKNWTWAGGANYVWSSDRTSLTVSLSRRITDGAGLEGIVQLFSTSAEVHRRISKHWKGELLFADARNRPLVSTFSPLSYISYGGGLTRELNRRVSLECQYWHLHDTSSTTPLAGYLADHNRVSISVLYDLKVPLQR